MSYLIININKTIFPFGGSVSDLFIVLINFMQNVGSVFHYFLVINMADRFQTSSGLSIYVIGGLHKVLTLPTAV